MTPTEQIISQAQALLLSVWNRPTVQARESLRVDLLQVLAFLEDAATAAKPATVPLESEPI